MRAVIASVALCACSAVASASILVDEGFGPGYSDGTTVVGIGPARTGFAASPWTAGTVDSKRDFFHRSEGLTHSVLTGETPGHLEGWVDDLSSPPNGGSISRALDYSYADPNNVDEVWGAFLFRFNDVDGQMTITLGDSTGNGRSMALRINVSGGEGILQTMYAGRDAVQVNFDSLEANQVHLAVFRLTEDPTTFYDPHTLWVNPTAEDILPGDIAGGKSGTGITLNPNLVTNFASAWNSLQLVTNSQNGSMIDFDEFRLSESLDGLGLVPEPATLSLLALGGLTLLRRRAN